MKFTSDYNYGMETWFAAKDLVSPNKSIVKHSCR